MFDKIVFFELRHYGDLHITRNLVGYIQNIIPAKDYVYVLTCDSKVFSDFRGLRFEQYDPCVHPFSMYDGWKILDNVLYINTSCGTNSMAFFQGTTVQTAHSIFKYYLKQLLNHDLPDDLRLFLPTIEYRRFEIEAVNDFMSYHDNRKKVLFVNGETQSGQVLNFDMYPLFQILANEFPSILFFVTNPIESLSFRHGRMLCKEKSPIQYEPGKNIISCSSILNIKGNDIVETSYFSQFCDVIIGRSSGVYTLSIEKKNIIDKPKKFICFSHREGDKDLGVTRIIKDAAPNFIWSPNYNYSSMLEIIRNHLR